MNSGVIFLMTLGLTCDSDFSDPGSKISQGEIVIYPTDTVYGLGTNPRIARAVRRCYEIKKRDAGKKMPVLVHDLEKAMQLAEFSEKSRLLANKFWPGKLSIVLRASEMKLPEELIGADRTIALRVPKSECALRLISASGGALVGTSANISGEDPITNSEDPRLAELTRDVDYFVTGSSGDGSGLSSTVIDATNEERIRILREGAIPSEEIFDYLEKISRTDLSRSAICSAESLSDESDSAMQTFRGSRTIAPNQARLGSRARIYLKFVSPRLLMQQNQAKPPHLFL
jgi:L-threonylcarbamoyladenylate synthase